VLPLKALFKLRLFPSTNQYMSPLELEWPLKDMVLLNKKHSTQDTLRLEAQQWITNRTTLNPSPKL
jgi:hypothetical protein